MMRDFRGTSDLSVDRQDVPREAHSDKFHKTRHCRALFAVTAGSADKKKSNDWSGGILFSARRVAITKYSNIMKFVISVSTMYLLNK